MKRIVVLVVLCCSLALVACAVQRPLGLTSPTPTAVATYAPPTTDPVARVLALTQDELLGAPGITAGCDAPPEADFKCEAESVAPVMEVNIPSSTYARWSLRWGEVDAPLTGDETLMIHLTRSGTVAPNLYLVAGERQPDGRQPGPVWAGRRRPHHLCPLA